MSAKNSSTFPNKNCLFFKHFSPFDSLCMSLVVTCTGNIGPPCEVAMIGQINFFVIILGFNFVSLVWKHLSCYKSLNLIFKYSSKKTCFLLFNSPAIGGPSVRGTDLRANRTPTPCAILSLPTMSPVRTGAKST